MARLLFGLSRRSLGAMLKNFKSFKRIFTLDALMAVTLRDFRETLNRTVVIADG